MNTDNTQDGAEPSPASAGSHPVAWQLWGDESDDGPFDHYITERLAHWDAERLRHENPAKKWFVVPLYRQPQHRLVLTGMENDMSNIADAIYRHLRTMAPHQLERLTAIQLKEAADEIARLRLTDAERAAIEWASTVEWGSNPHAATLRALLERLK